MQDRETKNLVFLGMYCFMLSLAIGITGSFFELGSRSQVLLFSINDTLALAGCVLIGRYVGMQGEHIAASGFVMLGIVHGISAGSSINGGINMDSVRLVIPLIPSLLLIAVCRIFPLWLRILGLTTAFPFLLLYYYAWTKGIFQIDVATIAYSLLGIVEICWGIYVFLFYRKATMKEQSEN